jgi:hypothetical protein
MRRAIASLLALVAFGGCALANMLLVPPPNVTPPPTTRTIWTTTSGAVFATIGARTMWTVGGAVKQ